MIEIGPNLTAILEVAALCAASVLIVWMYLRD